MRPRMSKFKCKVKNLFTLNTSMEVGLYLTSLNILIFTSEYRFTFDTFLKGIYLIDYFSFSASFFAIVCMYASGYATSCPFEHPGVLELHPVRTFDNTPHAFFDMPSTYRTLLLESVCWPSLYLLLPFC